MENHHVEWVIQLYLPFSIVMLIYQRVFIDMNGLSFENTCFVHTGCLFELGFLFETLGLGPSTNWIDHGIFGVSSCVIPVP